MLHIAGLHKSFFDPGRGEVKAVDGIELQVPPGVVAVMGANGAGKTTLLRLIAGLLEPDSGTIAVAGLDSVRDGDRFRAQLGYLSTSTKLPALATPREFLALIGQLHGLHPAAVAQRLEALVPQFGLADILDQRIATLSTGQAQRVNLARTLLADPPLLILDEPTTGLDVLAAAEVVTAVQRCRDQGRLILYCTHVPAEAQAVADQLLLIGRGQVAYAGTIADLADGGDFAPAVHAILRPAVAS